MPTISTLSPTLTVPRSTRRVVRVDGEHVLDGHQEGQVSLALGGGDPGIDSVHQFPDAGVLGGVRIGGGGLQDLQGAALDDGGVVAGEAVGVQQLADFHFHQLQELGVVNLIDLVQENNDIGHVDLAGQEQVLTGLSHGAVGGGDDQDSAVHLGSTGDHVLDIVGMARAVNVGIVAGLGLILDVSGVDRDAAGLLFGGLVDLIVSGVGGGIGVSHSQNLGDGGGEGGLAMVDMTDGADIYMGFGSFEFLLRHLNGSSSIIL